MKAWLCALSLVLLGGCALPPLEGRSISVAAPPTETASSRLGQALQPRIAAHPAQSGMLALSDPQAAFAARSLIAQAADKTLDVQYYIWHRDTTGLLLLESLCDAADRGVRVRLLVDDNGIPDLDDLLVALSAHRNIEVRLFNPFPVRSFKPLGYLTQFSRANRRMHSKSFTADNQVTIIGGRNIADEYFAASEGIEFADLDVLAIGTVVREVSEEFDQYWASASAYPIERLVASRGSGSQDPMQAVAAVKDAPAAARYLTAVNESQVVKDLVADRSALQWSRVRMISDDPAKGLGQAEDKDLMLTDIGQAIRQARRHVDIVSPYFVPTEAGVTAFRELTSRQVRVRVLTNALESTDVMAVHAGYAKRRKALLQAGVELFELRRAAGSQAPQSSVRFGSSGASLHAKTFAVDDEVMFIGSFNFDPRSARLNTELGFLIDSPTFAKGLSSAFDTVIPQHAYEVRLSPAGELYWLEWQDGKSIRHDTEPGTGPFERFGVDLLSVLPIEWLL
ncbi:phospholipase D family protein [soil metagenome]